MPRRILDSVTPISHNETNQSRQETIMCQCEDRPCCGHDAEERADDQYQAEKDYYGNQEDEE